MDRDSEPMPILKEDDKSERQNTNFQVLFEYGFSGSEIQAIANSFQSPFTLGRLGGVTTSRLLNLERKLKAYGGTREDVKTIIKKRAQLLSTKKSTVNAVLKHIESHGELRKHPDWMLRIVTEHPQSLTYQIKWISRFFSAFTDYGFTEDLVVKKVLLADPQRLRNSGKDIQNRLINLEDLGFEKGEVIAIACRFPQIIGYDIGRTNSAFRALMKERAILAGKVRYKADEAEARAMVKKMPQLLGLSEDTTDAKIRLRMLIWHSCMRKNPETTNGILSDTRVLIQSRSTLLERVAYARKNDMDWRSEKYLYFKRSQFKKKFGVNL